VKDWLPKIVLTVFLLTATAAAFGGSFYGWFLPQPLKQPVSLREGSAGTSAQGRSYYWLGRTHYGGGYRGGK
jgi:hypothetical protein